MSENTKIDRRILRTKNALQAALKTLLEQKPYAKIKVSEIVEAANVARPTFYMHYETKDDLLFSLFNDVFDRFKSKMAAEFFERTLDTTNFAVELFNFWDEHSEIVKILLEAGIDLIVLEQLRQCTTESLEMYFYQRTDDDNLLIPYLSDSFAGSFFMILKRWIESGKNVPVEELGNYFSKLFAAQMSVEK